MRTAEEIKEASKCIPFPHMAVLSVTEIQSIIDEAVAHGMTIAAEIVGSRPVLVKYIPIVIELKNEILSAREEHEKLADAYLALLANVEMTDANRERTKP